MTAFLEALICVALITITSLFGYIGGIAGCLIPGVIVTAILIRAEQRIRGLQK